ncbi:MAG: DUF2283 domain-containing protein [Thermoplasmata archaeon]
MRVKVDLENDALYFRFCNDTIEESEEIVPGIVIDYNKDGKAVGIEIVGIREKIPPEELAFVKVDLPSAA